MRFINVSGLLLAFVAAACGAPDETAGTVESEAIGAAEAAIKLSDIHAVPAYFNHDNRFVVSDAQPWAYARLDAQVDKYVTVDVRTADGTESAPLGFKLYRVLGNGSLKLVKSVDGPSGHAIHDFKSKAPGGYVIEMATSGHLANLVLRLSCAGVAYQGECAAEGGGAKEGELCGGFAGIACAQGLYCAYASETNCGAGDQGGVCARRPDACIQIYDPVCGCDGHTYGNACSAASSGVSVAYDGECAPPIANAGESCGGFTIGPAPVCAEGLYCSYAIGDSCGWADAPGTCAEKPEACTDQYEPVCGCDGQTYGNACTAAMNGVAVLHEGGC